jgi:hypothetical protein
MISKERNEEIRFTGCWDTEENLAKVKDMKSWEVVRLHLCMFLVTQPKTRGPAS